MVGGGPPIQFDLKTQKGQFHFRQPRRAMHVVDEDTMQMEDDFDRLNNFREDMRIPEMFRSTLDRL